MYSKKFYEIDPGTQKNGIQPEQLKCDTQRNDIHHNSKNTPLSKTLF
jgi:hypothetical protein